VDSNIKSIEGMLSDLNRNAPVNRRSLAEHLESGSLEYETRGGAACGFERSGLDLLAAECTDSERVRLRLPILARTDPSSGEWIVEGMAEAAVAARLLGRELRAEGRLRIRPHDLADLKKTLPGLVFTIFSP
jgi:uncharacterized protein (UPF0216 family)